MTYNSDPTRWTHAPEAAPRLLSEAFSAARSEGPSDLQMRSLALKLAALSGSAAIAAAASTAQASTTAAASGTTVAGGVTTAASGGALSLTKIAVSIALLGAATGTVLYQRADAPTVERAAPTLPMQAPVQPPPVVIEPARGGPAALPTVRHVMRHDKDPTATAREADAPQLQQVASAPERAEQRTRAVREARHAHKGRAARARSEQEPRLRAAGEAASPSRAPTEPEQAPEAAASGEPPELTEIELLRRARVALTARPGEAYRLSELHRQTYPEGVFTQEREALAVEALLRAGELKQARTRAERFIERYPSSPHAHRFREAMGRP